MHKVTVPPAGQLEDWWFNVPFQGHSLNAYYLSSYWSGQIKSTKIY